MMKVRGTIKLNALEGGFWELASEDGRRFQLQGGDGGLLKEGQRVEVEGSVDRNTMTIGMVGEVLQVKTWKKLA